MAEKVSLSELKKKMGDEIVKKLYDEFAGRIIYVPKKGIDMTQEEKEKYILNLLESGVSYKKVAEEVGLSVDRIRKIFCNNYHKILNKN